MNAIDKTNLAEQTKSRLNKITEIEKLLSSRDQSKKIMQ